MKSPVTTAHITIDARFYRASGIGTYLRNLLPALIRNLSPAVRFTLLIQSEDQDDLSFPDADVRHIVPDSRPLSIGEQFEIPGLIPKDTDLLWIPHLNIPVRYRGPGRLLVTLHDLEMRHLSGGRRKLAVYLYSRLIFPIVRRRAAALLCDSKFTYDEWIRFYGRTRDVHVIPLGVEDAFFDARPAAADHLTPNPYLLYVGNVKPHKNLRRLIEAFLTIKDRIPQDLVIAGKMEGLRSADQAIPGLVAAGGDRIRLTGRVSQAELEALYAGADLFVFPSLYEGFGLPPLEAMAAGTAVAASDIPVVREACADAAVYFQPRDPDDIARAILAALPDQTRTEFIRKGRERAKAMNWDQPIAETLRVIREILPATRADG